MHKSGGLAIGDDKAQRERNGHEVEHEGLVDGSKGAGSIAQREDVENVGRDVEKRP